MRYYEIIEEGPRIDAAKRIAANAALAGSIAFAGNAVKNFSDHQHTQPAAAVSSEQSGEGSEDGADRKFGMGDWFSKLTGRTQRAEPVAQQVNPKMDEAAQILALTMWGEARGHGVEGMSAVGHVIKNRALADNKKLFGHGIKGVAMKTNAKGVHQFSCWNKGDPNIAAMASLQTMPTETLEYKRWEEAYKLAYDILQGRSEDPTGGALFYHTTEVHPSWDAHLEPVRQIANHIFYKWNGKW
jgi:N-acetylmuramoyl-L-alanine amidase